MAREFRYTQSDWEEDLAIAQQDDQGNWSTDAHGRLEVVAQDVALAKADAVCEAMILLAGVRGMNLNVRRKPQPGLVSIIPKAAQVQDVRASSDQFEQQAAHLVPGHLVIEGESPWRLVENQAPQNPTTHWLAIALRSVFAQTCILPAAFNRADSQAERSSPSQTGLKQLFADAVRKMWTRPATRVPGRSVNTPPPIDPDAIREGLCYWFERLGNNYESAAAQKLSAHQTATDASTRERRLLEYRILCEYERSLKIANPLRRIYATPALASALQRFQS